jgi:hypothetical protein
MGDSFIKCRACGQWTRTEHLTLVRLANREQRICVVCLMGLEARSRDQEEKLRSRTSRGETPQGKPPSEVRREKLAEAAQQKGGENNEKPGT